MIQSIYNLGLLEKQSISKKNGNQGIYLWGVKLGSRYIPLYVGKGRNIHERIFQHLCRWRGGEYRVPAWDEIINPKLTSIPFVENANLLYIPHGPLGYKKFLNNEDIQLTIQKVLDNFFCCLHYSDNSNLSDDEDALATTVGKGKLISTHRKNPTMPTQNSQDLYNQIKNH
jgi:hypothetical protein